MYNMTIIIPHYNDVERCQVLAKSILQEQPGHIQLIIVDDGSEHSAIEILNQLSTIDHCNVLHNSRGKGAGGARNTALEHTLGQWILFADSDDRFMPGFYNIVMQEVFKQHQPDIVFFKPTSHSETAHKKSRRHVVYASLVDRYLKYRDPALKYRFTVPWSKVFKADFIERHQLQFDECIASNDALFSLKTGHLAKTIAVSDQTIYSVLERSQSLTKRVDSAVTNSRFNAMKRYNVYVAKHKIPKKFQCSLLAAIKMYWWDVRVTSLTLLLALFLKNNWRWV